MNTTYTTILNATAKDAHQEWSNMQWTKAKHEKLINQLQEEFTGSHPEFMNILSPVQHIDYEFTPIHAMEESQYAEAFEKYPLLAEIYGLTIQYHALRQRHLGRIDVLCHTWEALTGSHANFDLIRNECESALAAL